MLQSIVLGTLKSPSRFSRIFRPKFQFRSSASTWGKNMDAQSKAICVWLVSEIAESLNKSYCM